MSDVVLILESPHLEGRHYRVDTVIDSIQHSDLSFRLYAWGGSYADDERTTGWEIGHSIILRLLNLLTYLATLRSFAHFGFLLKMWTPLVKESPQVIVFYNHWTGLFLHFWRKVTESRARLIWDWQDLSTRMQYHGRRMGPGIGILLNLEERLAPRYFDGLVVPTEFAQQVLQRWGHPASKIHILGDFLGLNPYVSQETLKGRTEGVRKGGVIHLAWVGVIRGYQLEGLTRFFQALTTYSWATKGAVIHLVGPSETASDSLMNSIRGLPPEIDIHWHGFLPLDELYRLLAESHAAIQVLPAELFSDFIHSWKMAVYLAASLPVVFSAVKGVSEVAEGLGVPFNLRDPESIVGALTYLTTPDHYGELLSTAWKVAQREYSQGALERKGQGLVQFLRGPA